MLAQVGRWVKADDLRLAMEREQKSIHKEEAKGGSEDRCGSKHGHIQQQQWAASHFLSTMIITIIPNGW